MKINRRFVVGVLSFLILAVSQTAYAGQVRVLNTFQSGDTTRASEVNGNVTGVKTAVRDNDGRIVILETAVAAGDFLTLPLGILEPRRTYRF